MTHNNPQPSRYQSRPFEMVLDFCVELSRRMIMSGANVERVNLAVDRVLSTYELNDSSIFILPTYVSVSAKDQSGYSSVRQASIPAGGINQKNSEMVRTNGFDCALTLVSMSVGFALSFAIAHYVRKAKNK